MHRVETSRGHTRERFKERCGEQERGWNCRGVIAGGLMVFVCMGTSPRGVASQPLVLTSLKKLLS